MYRTRSENGLGEKQEKKKKLTRFFFCQLPMYNGESQDDMFAILPRSLMQKWKYHEVYILTPFFFLAFLSLTSMNTGKKLAIYVRKTNTYLQFGVSMGLQPAPLSRSHCHYHLGYAEEVSQSSISAVSSHTPGPFNLFPDHRHHHPILQNQTTLCTAAILI